MKTNVTTTSTYTAVDTIILPLFEGDRGKISALGGVFTTVAKMLPDLAKSGAFERKAGSSFTITTTSGSPTVIALGMGKAKESSKEKSRQAGGAMAGILKQLKSRKVGVISNQSKSEVPSLIEGICLGGYSFEKYKSKKKHKTQ